jgi:hypothetical protein
MKHSSEFRRCLVDCDVGAIKKLWAHVAPGAPQPKDDHQALSMLHFARTKAASVPPKLRYYSHRWLLDRDLPTGLPDRLKPKAERMYPRVVEGVGIAVKATSQLMKPVSALVHQAMTDAVSEAYADGVTDPAVIKQRIQEARQKSIKQLIGR